MSFCWKKSVSGKSQEKIICLVMQGKLVSPGGKTHSLSPPPPPIHMYYLARPLQIGK